MIVAIVALQNCLNGKIWWNEYWIVGFTLIYKWDSLHKYESFSLRFWIWDTNRTILITMANIAYNHTFPGIYDSWVSCHMTSCHSPLAPVVICTADSSPLPVTSIGSITLSTFAGCFQFWMSCAFLRSLLTCLLLVSLLIVDIWSHLTPMGVVSMILGLGNWFG